MKVHKSLIALISAFAVVVAVVSFGSASADPSYSTDQNNPTVVDQVPEGFTASGDPVVVEDDCVTTTTSLFSRTVVEGYEPAVEEVSHQEYKYSKQVEKFKTKYQYQKQTKTTVSHGNGNGNDNLVSDWAWWSPASTQWSFSNVAVLESGNHADWTQGHGGHTDYYKRTYRYVKNGVTQQVPDGTETVFYNNGNWTTDTPGSPWVKIDERKVVDIAGKPAVPGVEVTYYVATVETEGESCPTSSSTSTSTTSTSTTEVTTTTVVEVPTTTTVVPPTTAAPEPVQPKVTVGEAKVAFTG